MIEMSASIFLAAVVLDIIVGDPRVGWHPVILIGNYISFLDNKLRLCFQEPWLQRVTGAFLVLCVVLTAYGATAALLYAAYHVHTWVGVILAVILLSSTIATKSLAQAGMEIYQVLQENNMAVARQKLSWIVGRDTAHLETGEIVRGTVETVAENIVDGIISPLFYALLGGVPLAMAYRAVNTMDSMLGYKNEKYLYFGWAAARLDDVANFIPARITGFLLLAVSLLMSCNTKGAWQAIRKDAPGHPSPNSGIPEAAVAGALGIRLGGQNYYQGISSLRAYMGEPMEPLAPKHIVMTVRMMYGTVVLFTMLGLLFIWRM
jgi:adenosylcobinamide-phosphate synthase